ncbi:ADP-ribosylhydrolase ARH1 isoform X2 [Nematostella vectensis]|uniref:ADP-ribosylhydrolase ARH1 isoform X2 n=1 Tax=Nematostella vectensis TaxID=45351 RepID=UPI0013906927|nr:ADP-ribosylhydrolase ARH1 isoform X2 [Nematostella vectensis]
MEKFVASMLLSAAGDALGFKNSEWEFQHDGEKIHKQLKDLGGVANLKVSKKNWRVSDDTILHIATGEALVSDWSSKEELYLKLAANYKEGMRDMRDRAAGNTLQMSIHQLKPGRPGGYIIPFNPRGGGCGAAMRSMCIGLLLYRPEHLDDLIAVSVESGRMTHNHPTDRYTVSDRDKFYKSLSYSGWAGSSGHDAPMIAYDALLGAGDSWEELCHRGMFHGGDSDSTGVMAGAWWGALHGFDGVPVGNYKNLEYRERIENIAKKLYEKAVTLGET